MTRVVRFTFVALFLAVATPWGAPPPAIALVGKGVIGGTLLDKSGLTGSICEAGVPENCVPKAILGGLGSDLTYTGHDNVFIAAPDRGPFDGLTDVPFLDRVHFLHLTLNVNATFPNISTQLLDTRFLQNEFGQKFVGAAGAFDLNNPFATLRLDPEGIRVGPNGNFYISDEYGPYLLEFNRQGQLVRRIDVPAPYLIANPSADPNVELLGNTSGRQANRGMEGLAITPGGGTLVGMMQNALLQDNALAPGTVNRQSVNTRIITVDLLTGESHQYVYVLDAFDRGQGVSEILAINDHEFLVVERDNRSWLTSGTAPTRKNIYKIDISGATDVSAVATLPAGVLPAEIVPVAKSIFISMLDPIYGLHLNDANAIGEKIEGLAWGPDLADGRHVLYVASDNDLDPLVATQLFAFAIDASSISLQPQVLPGPLYPPGQVKKALK